ncbi:hypothetical protein IAD21_02266 [Abditibacteriota bacterium]|nr:hypothetical protein IAD21_02266 [Abditibacteriota bacterium]
MLASYVFCILAGRSYSGLFRLFTLLLSVGHWVLFILYFVLLNRFIAIAASGPSSNNEASFAPIVAP